MRYNILIMANEQNLVRDYWKGKQFSDEHKRKISIGGKGKHSLHGLGKHNSPSTEFKPGHSLGKGRHPSDEHKSKISQNYHNVNAMLGFRFDIEDLPGLRIHFNLEGDLSVS